MLFQEYYAAAVRLGWFDPCFYFDLLQSRGISIHDKDLSLFEHYATIGWKRGLSPSDRFSVRGYLARYQDVEDRQVDPLYHYLVWGQKEQRQAFPLFDHSDEVQFVGVVQDQPEAGGDWTQLALARANGISAFCLHYDAGRGRDVSDGIGPDTPFCLFLDYGEWARRDGDGEAVAEPDTSLEARYGLAHEILNIMSDPRHLRVRGKPLLVVHRPERLERASLIFDLWREAARRAGLGGVFVAGLPHTGAGETLGLDGLINAPAVPGEGIGPDRLSTTLPVFPGFMPDRDPSAWPGAGAGATEIFTAWSASAAECTEALYRRNLPRLAFIDARIGRGDGWQDFLKGAAPASQRERMALSKLRRFADTIAASSRLPVLFLHDESSGSGQDLLRRLIASLRARGGIECFALVDSGDQTREVQLMASSFNLDDLDGIGWSREQAVEYLAGLLRGRGDLVVVSGTMATAGLLASFTAQGHGTLSILHDLTDGADLDELGHCAQRIIVSSRSVQEQVGASGAIPGHDIRLIEPPSSPEPAQTWTRYVDEIAICLTGLGNDGRRLRSTGGTFGRQEVAEDLCVVIPSYNHRPYIVAALDSVLAQSLRPREIRIIDDGSDDGSAELVRSLARDDLGIFVETRENRGAQATINQGIAATRCPIVAVMNSDDRWHPLRIEELIGHVRREGGADVVFSRLRLIGPRHRREHKRNWYERGVADYNAGSPLWLALMFCNFFFTTSNLIARREKFMEIGGFGPLRYCHDLDYMLKAMSVGQIVQFDQRTLCDYRVHARNTIDEDVEKVLFEEAWIIVKTLRRSLGRIGETELLNIVQRVYDKGLASRVLGILRILARGAAPFDDRLVYSESQFVGVIEHNHRQDAMKPRDLVDEIAQLVAAQGADPVPTVNA
jgi:glycosyltransferase involved in cell wall biosynthesis